MKVAVDDMQMSGNGCVPIKSYLQNKQTKKQSGRPSFTTPWHKENSFAGFHLY